MKENKNNIKTTKELEEIKLYNLELDEFKKIKTAPKDRWFNSVATFLIAGISIFSGVIIICTIILSI